MAAVTIDSDFGAQKVKSDTVTSRATREAHITFTSYIIFLNLIGIYQNEDLKDESP